MAKELNWAQQNILNRVYQASSAVMREREANGSYKGNSHHVSQTIQEETKKLLQPLFNDGVFLDNKDKAELTTKVKKLLSEYEQMASDDPSVLVEQFFKLRLQLAEILDFPLIDEPTEATEPPMGNKYLYNDVDYFDPESPSYQWADSREEAIAELAGEDGFICEAVEDTTMEVSVPDAKDLVDSLLIDEACSDYCDQVYAKIDLKALQAGLDPLFAKISSIVVAAVVAAAGPLYRFGDSEFIEAGRDPKKQDENK